MNGLICDHCGEVLAFDANNGREDEAGEKSAWISIAAAGFDYDACSRSCATELLGDGSPMAQAIEAHMEVIASIVRTIREGREGDDEDDGDA